MVCAGFPRLVLISFTQSLDKLSHHHVPKCGSPGVSSLSGEKHFVLHIESGLPCSASSWLIFVITLTTSSKQWVSTVGRLGRGCHLLYWIDQARSVQEAAVCFRAGTLILSGAVGTKHRCCCCCCCCFVPCCSTEVTYPENSGAFVNIWCLTHVTL